MGKLSFFLILVFIFLFITIKTLDISSTGSAAGTIDIGVAGPPAISNIQVSGITTSRATITWSTSLASNSTINYGTTTALETSVSNSTLDTGNFFVLTGLSSSTIYYYNLTACGIYDSCTSSGQYNFTTQTPEQAVTPAAEVGGAPAAKEIITIETILPEKSAIIKLESSEVKISEIEIFTKKEIKNIQISVKESQLPQNVPSPVDHTGAVYKYIEIDKNIKNEDIKKIKVKFQIEKSWLEKNNGNSDLISLSRLVEEDTSISTWAEFPGKLLKTEKLSYASKKSDELYLYETELPGLSLYAITAKKLPEIKPEILFDIGVSIPPEYERITPEEYLQAIVTIFNFGAIDSADVLVDYTVKDKDNNNVFSENETITIDKVQISFTKLFKLPNLKPGEYKLEAKLTYKEFAKTVSSSFYIAEVAYMPIGLAILIVIITAGLIISRKALKKKKIEKIEPKEHIIKIKPLYKKPKSIKTIKKDIYLKSKKFKKIMKIIKKTNNL